MDKIKGATEPRRETESQEQSLKLSKDFEFALYEMLEKMRVSYVKHHPESDIKQWMHLSFHLGRVFTAGALAGLKSTTPKEDEDVDQLIENEFFKQLDWVLPRTDEVVKNFVQHLQESIKCLS